MASNTTNITSNSIPADDWTLHEWVKWHKELVKAYNSASMLVKYEGKTLGFNRFASAIWNREYDKLGIWNHIKNEISNPFTSEWDDDKKYLSMWFDLDTKLLLTLQEYDPTFTGLKIASDTVQTVASGIVTAFKIVKIALYVAPVIGIAILGTYMYSTFKKK